jgi:hypothetical protein
MSRIARTRYEYRLDPSGLSWSYVPIATRLEHREGVSSWPRRDPLSIFSGLGERVTKWSSALARSALGKRLPGWDLT